MTTTLVKFTFNGMRVGEYRNIIAGMSGEKMPYNPNTDDPGGDGFFSMEIEGDLQGMKHPDSIEAKKKGVTIWNAPDEAFVPYSRILWVKFEQYVEGDTE